MFKQLLIYIRINCVPQQQYDNRNNNALLCFYSFPYHDFYFLFNHVNIPIPFCPLPSQVFSSSSSVSFLFVSHSTHIFFQKHHLFIPPIVISFPIYQVSIMGNSSIRMTLKTNWIKFDKLLSNPPQFLSHSVVCCILFFTLGEKDNFICNLFYSYLSHTDSVWYFNLLYNIYA